MISGKYARIFRLLACDICISVFVHFYNCILLWDTSFLMCLIVNHMCLCICGRIIRDFLIWVSQKTDHRFLSCLTLSLFIVLPLQRRCVLTMVTSDQRLQLPLWRTQTHTVFSGEFHLLSQPLEAVFWAWRLKKKLSRSCVKEHPKFLSCAIQFT